VQSFRALGEHNHHQLSPSKKRRRTACGNKAHAASTKQQQCKPNPAVGGDQRQIRYPSIWNSGGDTFFNPSFGELHGGGDDRMKVIGARR